MYTTARMLERKLVTMIKSEHALGETPSQYVDVLLGHQALKMNRIK
jgi:hypothetical protein